MRIRYKPKTDAIANLMAVNGIYTITQLAEMSYTHRLTVGKIVGGRINVTKTVADDIAKTLHCRTHDIFERFGTL